MYQFQMPLWNHFRHNYDSLVNPFFQALPGGKQNSLNQTRQIYNVNSKYHRRKNRKAMLVFAFNMARICISLLKIHHKIYYQICTLTKFECHHSTLNERVVNPNKQNTSTHQVAGLTVESRWYDLPKNWKSYKKSTASTTNTSNT